MCRVYDYSTQKTRKSMKNKGLLMVRDFFIFEGQVGQGFFSAFLTLVLVGP